MSAYRDFLFDYPQRCKELLQVVGPSAQEKGLEVTLMLSIAAAGFVTPYERFRIHYRNEDHASGDAWRFAEQTAKFRSLLDENFVGSALWPVNVGTWKACYVDDVSGDPDSWKDLRYLRPISHHTVHDVIYTLRCGLAHGNIFSYGGSPIKRMIFFKEARGRFFCVIVSPDDFRFFLENWFSFLTEIGIPDEYFKLRKVA